MSADTVTPPPVSASAVPRTSGRLRWLKRLLPLFTMLLLGVWFAPAIVAKTELRNRFARHALADVRGSVEVGGASLGWLSPVELRDVVIRDDAGQVIASVGKITSQRSLVGLARNQSDPGAFAIENPTLAVVCAKGTTNVEGAFAKFLQENPNPTPTRTPVNLKVTGGTLTITDADTGKATSVEGIGATVSVPANRSEPIAVQVTATTGNLNAELSIGDTSTAKVVADGFALDTFAPFFKRVDPALSLAGRVGTDLRVTWGTDASGKGTLTLVGTASGKRLAVSAPGLNGDTLVFDSVEVPLDLELTGRGLRVRAFDLTCDFGTVSVQGTFNPEEAVETLLAQPGASVTANVEVAKLASKLPRLMRVKDGTELREGNLKLKLVSKSDRAGGTIWEGNIDTSALKATRDGKPIAWEQPLQIEFAGRYVKGELPTFDKFVCKSDFIAVNAEVKPETVRAAAVVYLDKLGARLADFVDLDGFTLAGEASASLVGRRDSAGAFGASATVELKNFAIMDRTGKGLKEPALKLQINATGKLPDSGPVQLATAAAVLTANGDELRLTLHDPVSNVRELSNGSVDVQLSGELAAWKARVGAFVPLPEFKLSGALDARGKAHLAPDRVTVDRLTVTLTKPKLERWIALDEPSMNAVGDLVFTRANRVATVTKLTLNSVPLTVTAGALAFELPTGGDVVVSGSGQCIADLNRIGKTVKLYTDPNGPDALSGRGAGPIKFRTTGAVTTFGGALDVTDFGYGPKADFVWFEPTLRVEVDGTYTSSTDAVALAFARAERPGFTLDAKGALSNITATRDVNFTGTLRYDWEKLTPLARKFAGATFTATGTGSRGFALTGQLEPGATNLPPEPKTGTVTLKPPAPKVAGPSLFAALTGEAAIGWNSLRAYGFDVGASELSAKMTRGVVTVAPLGATFGGGRAAVTPTLDLTTTPGFATLAKGAVIDHAKLTPQATAGALGYALPAIANAAQAEGEISAVIAENRISLGDTNQTKVAGTIVIHKATVGLNPVGAQIANLLGATATTMTLANESAVPVQIANGRVHHQNFALRIAGTTFHTSGSVGFDDTLDLVVDVPLPKDSPLLMNNPLLMKAVAGKVVKVPLKGTLTKPTLDPKALNNALVALAREGAKDVGKDVLEGELKKLFPGAPATGGGIPIPLPFGKKP